MASRRARRGSGSKGLKNPALNYKFHIILAKVLDDEGISLNDLNRKLNGNLDKTTPSRKQSTTWNQRMSKERTLKAAQEKTRKKRYLMPYLLDRWCRVTGGSRKPEDLKEMFSDERITSAIDKICKLNLECEWSKCGKKTPLQLEISKDKGNLFVFCRDCKKKRPCRMKTINDGVIEELVSRMSSRSATNGQSRKRKRRPSQRRKSDSDDETSDEDNSKLKKIEVDDASEDEGETEFDGDDETSDEDGDETFDEDGDDETSDEDSDDETSDEDNSKLKKMKVDDASADEEETAGTSSQSHAIILVTTLQEHVGTLILAVNNDIELFGTHLVQHGFLAPHQMSDISGTMGIPNSAKSRKLLEIVIIKIKTAQSKESAQVYFNKLVHIIAVDLGLREQAESLVTNLESKDRWYSRPPDIFMPMRTSSTQGQESNSPVFSEYV